MSWRLINCAIIAACLFHPVLAGDLVLSVASHHFGDENFNEFNPGIGYMFKPDGSILGADYVHIGGYDNSVNRLSVYGSLGYNTPVKRLSIEGGYVTGYDKWLTAAIYAVFTEGPVRILLIPPINEKKHPATIGMQLKF